MSIELKASIAFFIITALAIVTVLHGLPLEQTIYPSGRVV